MSERQKARSRARQRYRLDYAGILLNTGVSVFSSVTATGLLNLFQDLAVQQMPIVFGVLFVAQVLPKLLVELNKSYARNKARREGFSDGLLTDDFETGKKKMSTLDYFFSSCDHASYF